MNELAIAITLLTVLKVEQIQFPSERIENIVGEGENAGHQ